MKHLITSLLNSDIMTTMIAKETGVSKGIISELRKGDRRIDDLTWKTCEALIEYQMKRIEKGEGIDIITDIKKVNGQFIIYKEMFSHKVIQLTQSSVVIDGKGNIIRQDDEFYDCDSVYEVIEYIEDLNVPSFLIKEFPVMIEEQKVQDKYQLFPVMLSAVVHSIPNTTILSERLDISRVTTIRLKQTKDVENISFSRATKGSVHRLFNEMLNNKEVVVFPTKICPKHGVNVMSISRDGKQWFVSTLTDPVIMDLNRPKEDIMNDMIEIGRQLLRMEVPARSYPFFGDDDAIRFFTNVKFKMLAKYIKNQN